MGIKHGESWKVGNEAFIWWKMQIKPIKTNNLIYIMIFFLWGGEILGGGVKKIRRSSRATLDKFTTPTESLFTPLDRCFICIVQHLRFSGFILYSLSFFLYSPFKICSITRWKLSITNVSQAKRHHQKLKHPRGGDDGGLLDVLLLN